MPRKISVLSDAAEVARPVAVSALAIALAVGAMLVYGRGGWGPYALASAVLVIALGAVLQVRRAVKHLHQRQQETRQAAQRAERHYYKVLRRLAETIQSRQRHTHMRARRIGQLARQMAGQLGLDRHTARLLNLAAHVYDIGMMAVPDRIVAKPARVMADEYRAVQKHPEASFRILQPLTFLGPILPAIRYHHERMNGTGYPHGLRGADIPLTARILAVADAYDAMTHDRPHRPAMSQLDALDELRRCAPAGYDPGCVDALEEVMHVRRLPTRAQMSAAGAIYSPAGAGES